MSVSLDVCPVRPLIPQRCTWGGGEGGLMGGPERAFDKGGSVC